MRVNDTVVCIGTTLTAKVVEWTEDADGKPAVVKVRWPDGGEQWLSAGSFHVAGEPEE